MRIAALAVSLSLCASYAAAQFAVTRQLEPGAGLAKYLIFSKTNGYRHASIPDAAKALQQWGPKSKIDFDHTEDSGAFTQDNLKRYDGVLFLMTTDDPSANVLNEAQRKAFHWFIEHGGHFVGVHAASVCLQTTEWYTKELGAPFAGHPRLQPQTFYRVGKSPITSMYPHPFTHLEELYRFGSDPRDIGAKVIIAAQDEHDSYAKYHGSPHPIAWIQEKGAGASKNATLVGRSFYSALGHTKELWQDDTYMEFMMAGIEWTLAAGTTLALNPDTFVGSASAYPFNGTLAKSVVVDNPVNPINITGEGVANAQTDPEDGSALSGVAKSAGSQALPSGEESAAYRVGSYALQAIIPAVLLSAIALGISF